MLKLGQLVAVLVENNHHTPDGFATGRVGKGESIHFFERIDLFAYPSWNDFLGKTTLAREGDIATIYKFIGRPHRIRGGEKLKHYDVYEILINGTIRQAFRLNLKPLKKSIVP